MNSSVLAGKAEMEQQQKNQTHKKATGAVNFSFLHLLYIWQWGNAILADTDLQPGLWGAGEMALLKFLEVTEIW